MSECIFCRIINGEILAQVLHEDQYVMAFRDINPAAPVHILIIPKKHLLDVCDLEAGEPDLWAAMIKAVKLLAEREGIAESGFRMVVNTGEQAGQTVKHMHLHLLGGRSFSGF